MRAMRHANPPGAEAAGRAPIAMMEARMQPDAQLIDTEPTRDKFVTALVAALADLDFVALALRDYRGADATLKSVDVRLLMIKQERKLSFTTHHKTRDIVKNYDVAEGIGIVNRALGGDFRKATLFTTGFDLAFDVGNPKARLKRSEPTHRDAPSRDHDRQKTRLIAASGKPYLTALKITDARGNVLSAAQDKYRQINRYVEVLSGLLKSLPPERLRKVVDMGAGKGYLTFALYDYLTNVLGREVAVEGVELRPDLVTAGNVIAAESGFDHLSFTEGSIESFDASGADVLVALHACDTATDDAIGKGIAADAELIVVAPCCHKQIRREIEAHRTGNDLDFLMQHGIFIERQAEMVTDAMRALILEYFGYTTKVFEFISDAHTPKNVLIVGKRNRGAQGRDPAILHKITAAKSYFGIGRHHLEAVVGLLA